MSIIFSVQKLRRSVGRYLFGVGYVVFFMCVLLSTPAPSHAASAEVFRDRPFIFDVFDEVVRQLSGVAMFTAQAIDAVLVNSIEVDNSNANTDTPELPPYDGSSSVSLGLPLINTDEGTFIINVPLSAAGTLTAQGESYLATTSITGPLTTDRLSASSLSVDGSGRMYSLQVNTQAGMQKLIVSGRANVGALSVDGDALFDGSVQTNGLLQADGGVQTNGADVDLGEGSLFAANVINKIDAGTYIRITGTKTNPKISVTLDEGVTSLNGSRGSVTLLGGTDISISDVTITNSSTLDSVTGRGGCVNCILDTYVANDLTIASGTIDSTVIGSTTPAIAYFTQATVGATTSTTTLLTVQGSGTSSFGGGVDLLSGCFSINGTCVASAASSTYISLSDTPGSFIANAIQYVNGATDAITQSSSFVFDGTHLGVGTSSPTATLTVDGGTFLAGAVTVDGNVLLQNQSDVRWYDGDNSNYVGFRSTTTLSGNSVWTLPDGDGNTDEVLVTNGSGDLRFEPVSAIGGGVTEYINLIDTPSSFTAGLIPFTNASSTALTESTEFRYDGTYFAIGAAAPTAELSVDGSVDFVAGDGSVDFTFDDVSKLVGIGTPNPTDKLTVNQGSIFQIGGSASDIYTPTLLRTISTADDGRDIKISGSYAYLVTESSGDDFHIFDISDTANPSEVGSLGLPARGNGLEVVGQYAYVVSSFLGDDFHVIDVSDPTAPVEVDSINLPSTANGIAVQGDYAYVAVDGTVDNIQVIDISNPLKVVSVGSTSLATNVTDIAVRGNYAYAVTEVAGDDFHVIDVSDPTAPVEVDSINLPDTANVVTIDSGGLYAYVGTNATGDDLHVIDISDPLNITNVGGVELGVSVTGMHLVGTLLYVTSLSFGSDLHIFDVTNPVSPVLFGEVDLGSGNVFAVSVIGKYAYPVSTGGFGVVDISGAETQSVFTHSLQAGDIFVTGGSNFAKDVSAQGVIYAGGGIQSAGELKINGSSGSYITGGLSVGTTSSSSALTVDGTINATNLLGGATNITTDANGNIIRDPSDVRLKTNIVTIDNALTSLMQLRGVRYQWRDPERFGAQTEIGFIAQEVEPVLPEVIRKGGDYWSINTRNIIAVVVEAVKDIWGTVQGNSARIEALELRIQELEMSAPTTVEPPLSSDDTSSDDANYEEQSNDTDSGVISTSSATSTTDTNTEEDPGEESHSGDGESLDTDTLIEDVQEGGETDLSIEVATSSATTSQQQELLDDEEVPQVSIDTDEAPEVIEEEPSPAEETTGDDSDVGVIPQDSSETTAQEDPPETAIEESSGAPVEENAEENSEI